jgi:hypothetical protein
MILSMFLGYCAFMLIVILGVGIALIIKKRNAAKDSSTSSRTIGQPPEPPV